MINNVTLLGRLATDPELRYTQSGKAVCSFRLAVDRPFGRNAEGEKETDFLDIVAWEKSAEFTANYLKKGDMAAIVGRIQSRSWEAQDGTKRRSTEVVANDVRGVGGKPKPAAESSGDAAAATPPNGKARPTPVAVATVEPDFEDETLDFNDPFAEI